MPSVAASMRPGAGGRRPARPARSWEAAEARSRRPPTRRTRARPRRATTLRVASPWRSCFRRRFGVSSGRARSAIVVSAEQLLHAGGQLGEREGLVEDARRLVGGQPALDQARSEWPDMSRTGVRASLVVADTDPHALGDVGSRRCRARRASTVERATRPSVDPSQDSARLTAPVASPLAVVEASSVPAASLPAWQRKARGERQASGRKLVHGDGPYPRRTGDVRSP